MTLSRCSPSPCFCCPSTSSACSALCSSCPSSLLRIVLCLLLLHATLAHASSGPAPQVSKELATGHQTSGSALGLFPLLHHLLVCPVFRPAVVSDALIPDLAAYLSASASASVVDLAGIADFQVRFHLLVLPLILHSSAVCGSCLQVTFCCCLYVFGVLAP